MLEIPSSMVQELSKEELLLPWFKSSARKNCSIEVLKMLHQCEYELTPRQAKELTWGRFVNVHGVQGRNISADLHQEHLNRVCKESISDLHSNKTEKAITRVGEGIRKTIPVLDQFDNRNHFTSPSGAHRAPQFEKDRDMILQHLKHCNIFSHSEGRSHSKFSKPRDILHAISKDKLTDWIIEHIK